MPTPVRRSPLKRSPGEPPRTLSVAHAAELLDCSQDHVRRLMSDGHLGYLDIGRNGRAKIRIPVAVLERYVDSRTVNARRLRAVTA